MQQNHYSLVLDLISQFHSILIDKAQSDLITHSYQFSWGYFSNKTKFAWI